MDAKEPKCPICGGTAEPYEHDDRRSYGARCGDCGLRTDGFATAQAALEEFQSLSDMIADNSRLAAEVAELRKELEAAKGLVAHCWVHSGYQNCGYQQMDSEQQAMYEAIINRPTLAAPAATDCKHQRHEWAYTIGETSPDVEICLDCGKSRSHWEQGESDWLMVDVSGLKRAAPSATDRRCGSCGGSGLAIMFGGPHRTCPACCGTGAAPAATEPDAPTDKDFDNAIAEACRVEPADKICRTCGKWEPHGRDVAVFAYCSETNKSTRYNDSCDKHEEVRT
jgi:hypothetical protein